MLAVRRIYGFGKFAQLFVVKPIMENYNFARRECSVIVNASKHGGDMLYAKATVHKVKLIPAHVGRVAAQIDLLQRLW